MPFAFPSESVFAFAGIRTPGLFYLIGQLPTLPHTRACSTIGAEGLNFRVRDGNGWVPFATVTQKGDQLFSDQLSARFRKLKADS